MNYQQALDYLYSFPDSEAKLPRTPAEFNLPQTSALLAAFGEPQRSFPSVVIAGTKGKGSTVALLEAIARASGLRTGMWTSPHLHSYRERIQVDRSPISQAELIAAIEAIPERLAGFDRQRHGEPTIFQLGFAIALRYFADRAVDLAILEVGLGGRYDSANVVTPLLSVITSISYDHMAILGNTLGKIAWEKAGILKQGVPAITIAQHEQAMATIARVAAEVGAPLWVAAQIENEKLRIEHNTAQFSIFDSQFSIFDPFERYRGPTDTALLGVFQRENARLAVGAALLLREQGLPIGDAAIGEGLAGARWPGRMEIVAGTPPIVLDGAHNGDSAHKLSESLDQLFPGRRRVLVLGVTHGHSVDHILAELLPTAGALVLTRSRHPRALTDLAGLAARAEPLLRRDTGSVPLLLADDAPEALERARELAGPNDVICVTGSLFVVAAAREALAIPLEKD
ncbi:MAG TPA: folylpolyglutamate synthase/dihydrofolate synthase family protein [Roseiflexaceae bacterium]|nr:folylpolyglutamate synthase/dihydrofolate synthase family protein [Roseiflexaceae bacterium]